jgi:hypothetical protein
LGVFVGSEVNGPYGHGSMFEDANGLSVSVVMVVLCGFGINVEVQKFGPVESDALAALLEYEFCFFGKLNVSEHGNFDAVAGNGGLFSYGVKSVLKFDKLV